MTCERARSILIRSDISVGHSYKWALRVVERCVLSAAPGQPNGGKETS
jgi:hypothetical protein